jgi:outer membrane protein assembly factor BamB
MKARFFLAAFFMSGLTIGSSAGAADWPGFRGSQGGVADDKDLPVEWTKDNFLFKVKLPGVGASSPIISGDKVFVTCYSGYGTTITKGFTFGKGGKGKGGGGFGGKDTGGDQKKLKLHLVCLDAATGDVIWNKEIQPKLPEAPFSGFIREHGYASSTPVTDGKNIYVFFGKTGVLAFDLQGKQLWQSSVGSGKHMWGSAASPILTKDMVIVNAAIESGSMVALNKKNGKEAWRVKGVGTSWATPVLVTTKEGGQEIVLSQPGKVFAYDPDSGKELWQCEGIVSGGFGGGYTISSPVVRDGIVYIMGGGPGGSTALAVKAGGRGDVNKTHVLWRKDKGGSTCSPVLAGDNLCWVNGTLVALSTTDGKETGRERLYSSKSEYVSAVAAADKIFALTRFDGLYVVDRTNFKKLAHNTFEGDNSIFNASPAIANGRIYIRSNQYLYCIGNKGEK